MQIVFCGHRWLLPASVLETGWSNKSKATFRKYEFAIRRPAVGVILTPFPTSKPQASV